MKNEKSKTPLNEYKSLLPYFTRYFWHYFWGLICLVVVDAAQIIIPQLIRRAVDMISSGVFEWKEIVLLALWMIVIMGLISLGRFLWRYFIHGSSRRIETELREKLFDHLQTLSWDFYQKNKIGDLMARSINDLNAVRMAIGMGLVALVDSVVMATAILFIMFVQDTRSALFSVVPLPLVTALILFFGGMVGKKFRNAQETYSKMSDTVQEAFAGIRVIKSFVKEWWFIKKFADTNDDYLKANMELVRLFGFFFPFVTFLSELTVLIMLVIGGMRVITGLMSPGSLVALFRYLQMLIWPLMGAGFMVNMIQRGAVSLNRVNEILRTVPAIRDPEKPRTAQPESSALPALEIRDLSFSYNEERPALEAVNFSLKRGEWLGIMGRTGSGKSTLIKTFTRTLDPPAGTALVFGLDVREWPLAELRKLFAVSPQDSYLFSDSIQSNIAYGKDLRNSEDLRKAIGLASLEKDLETFNQGRETLIGERGLTLSGGQKQRVAIARALIMESEFLILDDSLSAVDAETERNILEGLLRERKGERPRTTIIVSHRVSTLRYADKVLVLDKGRIAEFGSPAGLAAAGGFYARMAALQRLGESPAANASDAAAFSGEARHG
ncbi:MAG: ABC transporter ATP-binding protein/permease [Treponema sp.]|jgi:ATP-binding cassette subfamily B protein|nr:ABC transporter ATP-binding protein/permease [Treponema sp.]